MKNLTNNEEKALKIFGSNKLQGEKEIAKKDSLEEFERRKVEQLNDLQENYNELNEISLNELSSDEVEIVAEREETENRVKDFYPPKNGDWASMLDNEFWALADFKNKKNTLVQKIEKNIPNEMKKLDRWAVCVLEDGRKKLKSIAKGATKVASNDSSTWTSFENVLNYIKSSNKEVYPMFALEGSGISVIDIDAHLINIVGNESKEELEEKNKKNKAIKDLSAKISFGYIKSFPNTYIELSCGGYGTHIYMKVDVNKDYKNMSDNRTLDIFDNKFIIMTGHKLSNKSELLGNESQSLCDYISYQQETLFSKKSNKSFKAGQLIGVTDTISYSDSQVIELMNRDEKASLLWNNKWREVVDENGNNEYGTQHYADYALIKKLVFYTRNNRNQSEKLFRLSPTYRAYGVGEKAGKYKYDSDIRNDLDRATNNCIEVYDETFRSEEILEVKSEEQRKEIIKKVSKLGFNCEEIDEQTLLDIYNSRLEQQDYNDVVNFIEVMEKDLENTKWKPTKKEIEKIIQKCTAPNTSDAFDVIQDYLRIYGEVLNEIDYVDGLADKNKTTKDIAELIKPILDNEMIYSQSRGYFLKWYNNVFMPCTQEMVVAGIMKAVAIFRHSAFKGLIDTMNDCPNVKDYDSVKAFESAIKMFNRRLIKKIKRYDYSISDSITSSKKCLEVSKVIQASAEDKKNKTKQNNKLNSKSITEDWDGEDIVDYEQTPYLNMLNGVYDIENKTLLKHDKKYRFDKMFGCDYKEDADCPRFKKMLQRFIPDDDTRREFIKFLGVILDKNVLEKKYFGVMLGKSGTGKSTIINTISKVLGDYFVTINTSMITGTKDDKEVKGPELLSLQDRLFVSVSELPSGSTLNSSKVKQWSGGTPLKGRLLNSNALVEFYFKGIVNIDTNYKPNLPPNDDATWKRLKFFNFEHPLKKNEIDTTLMNKLIEEKSGIFNLMIKGLEMYKEEGFTDSAKMLESVSDYKEDLDLVDEFMKISLNKLDVTDDGLFVNEKGVNVQVKDCFIDRPRMYKLFNSFCEYYKHKAYKKGYFYTEMEEKLQLTAFQGKRGYKGCTLSDKGFTLDLKDTLSPTEFAQAMKKHEMREEQANGVGKVIQTYNSTLVSIVDNTKQMIASSENYMDYVQKCIDLLKIPCKQKEYDIVIKAIKDNKEYANIDDVNVISISDYVTVDKSKELKDLQLTDYAPSFKSL